MTVDIYHSHGFTDLDVQRKHAQEIRDDKHRPREVVLHHHPKTDGCEDRQHEAFLFPETEDKGPALETEQGLSLSPESGPELDVQEGIG